MCERTHTPKWAGGRQARHAVGETKSSLARNDGPRRRLGRPPQLNQAHDACGRPDRRPQRQQQGLARRRSPVAPARAGAGWFDLRPTLCAAERMRKDAPSGVADAVGGRKSAK